MDLSTRGHAAVVGCSSECIRPLAYGCVGSALIGAFLIAVYIVAAWHLLKRIP